MAKEINPFLMFVGDAEKAMNFYMSLFPAILILLWEFFISEKKSPLFAKLNRRLNIES